MIKAIFPNIDTEQIEDIIDVYGMSKCRVTYDTDWWNTPYKTENEEEIEKKMKNNLFDFREEYKCQEQRKMESF